MKRYRLQFSNMLTMTESYIGKPLKRPRTTTEWIDIKFIITADNVDEAISKAISIAENKGWELHVVEELEA